MCRAAGCVFGEGISTSKGIKHINKKRTWASFRKEVDSGPEFEEVWSLTKKISAMFKV